MKKTKTKRTGFFLGGASVAGRAYPAEDTLSMTSTMRSLIGCGRCLLPQVVKFHQVRLDMAATRSTIQSIQNQKEQASKHKRQIN